MSIKAKDIAKELNLSPASVSLVLNNKSGVSDITRNRVFDYLKEIGHIDLLPDVPSKNRTILFLVYKKFRAIEENPHYFTQIFSKIMEGVEFQVKQFGYELMITYTNSETFNLEVNKIRTQNIQGLLILGTEILEAQLDVLKTLSVPLVMIDNYITNNDIDCITINNEQGVELAISHLVAKGHKDISYLHIKGNANNFNQRYFGFKRSVEENNLVLNDNSIISFSSTGGDAVYVELRKKLGELQKMPTAFFADNDIIAVWTIRILLELGYKVPNDISIIAFDNMPLAEILDPPLTTINIPKFEMGCIAVVNLLNKINHLTNATLNIELKTSLIERSSVFDLN